MSIHYNWFRGVVGLLVGLGAGTSVAAQSAVFPDIEPFEYPVASPRVSSIVGRVLQVGRGESRFGNEREAEVGIGETFSVFMLHRGSIPVQLGLGVEVYGRFSLDDPKSAMISTDWMVGPHLTVDVNAWRIDLNLYHESSHLGDEYAETFQAARLDWTREVGALWVRYGRGSVKAHVNLGYALVQKPVLRRGSVAVGLDYRGSGTLLGTRLVPVAGIFSEGSAATGWKVTTSARAGIELPSPSGRRALGLSLVYLNGLSTQRQFFEQLSRYVGAELRFEL